MVVELIVHYAGLRSTKQEKEVFEKKNLRLLPREWIGGFQRGLIVLKKPNLTIAEAYSVSGHFLVYDGTPGDISFNLEKPWTPQDASKRLKQGRTLETKLDLDKGDFWMVDITKAGQLLGTSGFKYMKLEEYLIHKTDAFPLLKKKHDKAFWEMHDNGGYNKVLSKLD